MRGGQDGGGWGGGVAALQWQWGGGMDGRWGGAGGRLPCSKTRLAAAGPPRACLHRRGHPRPPGAALTRRHARGSINAAGKKDSAGNKVDIWTNFRDYGLPPPLGLLRCDLHTAPFRCATACAPARPPGWLAGTAGPGLHAPLPALPRALEAGAAGPTASLERGGSRSCAGGPCTHPPPLTLCRPPHHHHYCKQGGAGGGAGCHCVRPALWGAWVGGRACDAQGPAGTRGSPVLFYRCCSGAHAHGRWLALAAHPPSWPARHPPTAPALPVGHPVPHMQVRAGGKKSVAKERTIRNREDYIPSTDPYTVAGARVYWQCSVCSLFSVHR